MGNSNRKQSKVLVVGLDNSGKSTIINALKAESKRSTELSATVGFQVEKLKYGAVAFTMIDMSGQGRYRNLWEHYYAEANGIIFVIDAVDTVRLCVVKDELEAMLKHADIVKRHNIPILFFANKSDLKEALTPAQLSEALELHKIAGRPWNIVASKALTGIGLDTGIKWLQTKLP